MTTETIPEALEWAAGTFGGAEAVVDGETRWSFEELLDEATRIARCLVASGIEPGDKVALWAPNSARWIATSFGVYLAGAVLVPINTRFKGMEAAHVLRRSQARLLCASTTCSAPTWSDCSRTSASSPSSKRRWCWRAQVGLTAVPWDAFIARADGSDGGSLPRVGAHDLADIIFTSGTTGAPKGAMLAHGPSVRTYEAWSDAVGLQQGDRYLCVYPFFHTAGLKSAVLACVLKGATVLPHAVFDPAVVMERVSAERITVLPGPPDGVPVDARAPGPIAATTCRRCASRSRARRRSRWRSCGACGTT